MNFCQGGKTDEHLFVSVQTLVLLVRLVEDFKMLVIWLLSLPRKCGVIQTSENVPSDHEQSSTCSSSHVKVLHVLIIIVMFL